MTLTCLNTRPTLPQERCGSSYLLPYTDVSLSDQNSRVMDRFSKSELEHLSLQATLQEVLHLQPEDVVQLHLALVQDADPDQPPEESVTLEQPPGVLLLQGEQLSGGRPDLGQSVLHPPHFSLVPQPVLADELELLVKPGLLEGPPGGGVGLGVDLRDVAVNHLDVNKSPAVLSCRSESSNISLVVLDPPGG